MKAERFKAEATARWTSIWSWPDALPNNDIRESSKGKRLVEQERTSWTDLDLSTYKRPGDRVIGKVQKSPCGGVLSRCWLDFPCGFTYRVI